MDFDRAPGWAYTWCFYSFGITLIIALSTIFSTVMSVRKVGVGYSILVFLLGAIATVNGMMSFWICRNSLRPQA